MKTFKKAVLIILMTEQLIDHGNWSGETSIQKAFYLLKALFKIRIDYDFILYKHGPYSFDLSDDLTAFRGYKLLKLKPHRKYSPRFLPDEAGINLKERFPKTRKKYQKKIDFVAEKLGDKGVFDLEKVSTAIYVIKEKEEELSTDIERSRFIHKKKKHISISDAKRALEEAHQIIENASSIT